MGGIGGGSARKAKEGIGRGSARKAKERMAWRGREEQGRQKEKEGGGGGEGPSEGRRIGITQDLCRIIVPVT